MIDALYIYVACAVATIWGFIIFSGWWYRTGQATTVFKYITFLFGAEAFEKTVFSFLRWYNLHGATMQNYQDVFASKWWFAITLPTTLVFILIVFVMTSRIIQSYMAINRSPNVPKQLSPTSRKVLVISNVQETRRFMRGAFISNNIGYNEARDVSGGIEMLLHDSEIAVVLIGLSSIEASGLHSEEVVKIIKRERPWAIVVAMTRTPNIYELFEMRRSYFDDYIYLPIRPSLLITVFDAAIGKINRWKKMNFKERRKKSDGVISDRRNFRMREKSMKDACETLRRL